MRAVVGILAVMLFAACGAHAAPQPLSLADQAAAFAAAGFKPVGKDWVRCDDTMTESRQRGSIEAADLNGDGVPEAWVRESSTFCYGNTAEAFVLLTKRDGAWVVLLDQIGVAVPRDTRHRGWPEIEVGGPGMGPFPLYRFDGAKYVAVE
jgi:hypothetical protein